MRLSHHLSRLARRSHRGPRLSTRLDRQTRPSLDSLEDRTLLNVDFVPHFGPETVQLTPHNDRNYTTMANVPVNLIFWGNY
jgi:hypothetical protein